APFGRLPPRLRTSCPAHSTAATQKTLHHRLSTDQLSDATAGENPAFPRRDQRSFVSVLLRPRGITSLALVTDSTSASGLRPLLPPAVRRRGVPLAIRSAPQPLATCQTEAKIPSFGVKRVRT